MATDQHVTSDAPSDGTVAPVASIVIETENVDRMGTGRLADVFAGVTADVARFGRPVELLVYADDDRDAAAVASAIDRAGADDVPNLTVTVVDDGPDDYYAMKNDGARRASAPFVVFADSDAPPVDGWLDALVDELEQGRDVVSGLTHVALDGSWYARALALVWNFPLQPVGDPGPASPTSDRFYANNFGVRRQLLVDRPFPADRRLRGQCGTWRDERVADGTGVWLAPRAGCAHEPYPPGHLVQRGIWQGHDRCVAAQLGSRRNRPGWTGAVAMLASDLRTRTERVLRGWRDVGLAPWQVPAAIVVGWTYSLANLGGFVATLVDPTFVERRVSV